MSNVRIEQEQINASFGDGTIQPEHLPDGITRPAHWPVEELEYKPWSPETSPFHIEWRRWQADPEGYTPPPPGTYN